MSDQEVSFSTEELVACLDREIKMRRRVYPRQVVQEKMDEEMADREIAMMEAIRVLIQAQAQPSLF